MPSPESFGEECRRAGKRIVFTNGCFDILHAGHLKILEEARSFGDLLVVGLNSDESVKRLKGPSRPVNGEDDRRRLLEALRAVDRVFVFDEDTPLELIKKLKPHILVKGADYAEEKIVGAAEVKSWGGEVRRVELLSGKSTTAVIEQSQSEIPNPKSKIAIIPARFASTRFPGKPLAILGGKPVIRHVWEKAIAAGFDRVIVATDDERIRATCLEFGAEVVMTSPAAATGSDRVIEALAGIEADIVANIQGDEPFLDAEAVGECVRALKENLDVDVATLAEPIRDSAELENPNVVKVVVDSRGRALYFSRSLIPFPRDVAPPAALASGLRFLKHIGVYVYRRAALERFVKLPQSRLETAEKLEQLRLLEDGGIFRVVETSRRHQGIDTPEDLARAEKMLYNS